MLICLRVEKNKTTSIYVARIYYIEYKCHAIITVYRLFRTFFLKVTTVFWYFLTKIWEVICFSLVTEVISYYRSTTTIDKKPNKFSHRIFQILTSQTFTSSPKMTYYYTIMQAIVLPSCLTCLFVRYCSW